MPKRNKLLLDANREVLKTGIKPSLPTQGGQFWADGMNVLFSEEGLRSVNAQFLLYNIVNANPVTGLMEADEGSSGRFIYAGHADKLYEAPEGSVTLTERGTGYTGNGEEASTEIFTRWSMIQWETSTGHWVVATNGKDEPQIYRKGTTSAFENISVPSDLTSAARWEILIKLGSFALALNTEKGDNFIEFCSADDILQWIPSAANSAGFRPVRNLDGPIVAAAPLGRSVAFYGLDSAHAITFIGAPFYFRIDPLLSGIGAVSKHSVVSDGRVNYGFGKRGLWATDGSSVRYLDTPDFHDFIFDDINLAQLSQCSVALDSTKKLLYLFFCSQNSNIVDRGLCYNFATGGMSPLDFARYSSTTGDVFDFPIFGDYNGRILQSGSRSGNANSQTSSQPSAPLPVVESYIIKTGVGAVSGINSLGVVSFGRGPFGGVSR